MATLQDIQELETNPIKYMDSDYRWFPLIVRSSNYVIIHGFISESFYNDYWQEAAERREQEELAYELDRINHI